MSNKTETGCKHCHRHLEIMDVWQDVEFLACLFCQIGYMFYKNRLVKIV